MLATAGSAPTDAAWAMEVKWDGIRAQLRFDGHTVCLRSRPGRDCTEEFPELAELADSLGRHRVVLDGELVCLDVEGRPDFAAIRARLGQPRRSEGGDRRRPAVLMVFDLLHLDGRAVRKLSYARRRELLLELELDGVSVRVPENFIGQGKALLAASAEQGLEGVVAKRLDAPYAEGRRSPAWIKQKHRRSERMVITGWREHDGHLPEFLLARRGPEGELRPAGSVSLGLDPERRASLLDVLASHEIERKPRRGSVRWASPVVEVQIDAHGTVGGPVRDPVLREVYSRTEKGLGTRLR